MLWLGMDRRMTEFLPIAFVIVSLISFIAGAYFGIRLTLWFVKS